MPVRYYNYHAIGFHYFLADLCYFVNLLLILSIWFFPQSKRLFISTYCLAFGNNAVAIAMWRNSLVFHSLDKVTSYVLLITSFIPPHPTNNPTQHEYKANEVILLQQPLHPHNAVRNPPRPCPPHSP